MFFLERFFSGFPFNFEFTGFTELPEFLVLIGSFSFLELGFCLLEIVFSSFGFLDFEIPCQFTHPEDFQKGRSSSSSKHFCYLQILGCDF